MDNGSTMVSLGSCGRVSLASLGIIVTWNCMLNNHVHAMKAIMHALTLGSLHGGGKEVAELAYKLLVDLHHLVEVALRLAKQGLQRRIQLLCLLGLLLQLLLVHLVQLAQHVAIVGLCRLNNVCEALNGSGVDGRGHGGRSDGGVEAHGGVVARGVLGGLLQLGSLLGVVHGQGSLVSSSNINHSNGCRAATNHRAGGCVNLEHDGIANFTEVGVTEAGIQYKIRISNTAHQTFLPIP